MIITKCLGVMSLYSFIPKILYCFPLQMMKSCPSTIRLCARAPCASFTEIKASPEIGF